MEQYDVTGMSCAACSARVEKAVAKVPGVSSVAVSLLTNSMGVEGTADPAAVVAAVEEAGYGASLRRETARDGDASASGTAAEDALRDKETPVLKRRLIASLGFLAVLMYFSMGHMMWGWPLPSFYDGNHVAMGLTELLLAAAVMVIGQKFFISGFRALWHRAPNMDTLVAMGSAAAFAYSTCALFAMTGAQVRGDADAVMGWMMELYFESAAMILALITVGKMLEARSKGRTTDALKSLMALAPETAVLLRDGEEVEVPIGEVRTGDVFVVRPGGHIPVDGVVLEGQGAVDEAALTGESVPADKGPGDPVSAATTDRSGHLKCRATRVGRDTTLSQIIRMVSDAAATKAPIAKTADQVSGVFVPAVLGLALLVTLVWLVILQRPVGYALARGISVLVISCPCALGLATPVAIMVGSGLGARNGILFKTAASLEETGRIQIVALDKTGTVTRGEPKVTDIVPVPGLDADILLRLAAAMERGSEHPLARAIVEAAEGRDLPEVTGFEALPGKGVTAVLEGEVLYGGDLASMQTRAPVPDEFQDRAERLAGEGKTPLFFSWGGKLCGLIAVADTLKEDSAQAVRELRDMGIRVVMLTGDNERTARAIGAQAGVDEVVAGVLPDGKERVIRGLKEQGKVAMVGDGINDAPALTSADTGIAIGAGTDVAIDAADVVLMKSRLSDVPAAIRLGRATLRTIRQGLFWAFFYNVIGIPIAAGVLIPLGITLDPMFGAAAMGLSSFCVVSNALRLNALDIRGGQDGKTDDASVSAEAGDGTAKRGEDLPAAPTPVSETIGEDLSQDAPGDESVPTGSVEASDDESVPTGNVEASDDESVPAETAEASDDESVPAETAEASDDESVPAETVETPDDESVPSETVETPDDESVPAETAEASDDESVPAETAEASDDESVPTGNVEASDDESVPTESGDQEGDQEEESAMEKTMKIEGMMCGHCEARVKKALEALDPVEKAVVSHEKGTAIVTLRADAADDDLRKVVEDQDYKVLEIA